MVLALGDHCDGVHAIIIMIVINATYTGCLCVCRYTHTCACSILLTTPLYLRFFPFSVKSLALRDVHEIPPRTTSAQTLFPIFSRQGSDDSGC